MFADVVCISAKTGLGLEKLSKAVLDKYKGTELLLRVGISQSKGKVQSFLRAYGTIVQETYRDGCVVIDARLGRNQLGGLKRLGAESIEIVN